MLRYAFITCAAVSRWTLHWIPSLTLMTQVFMLPFPVWHFSLSHSCLGLRCGQGKADGDAALLEWNPILILPTVFPCPPCFKAMLPRCPPFYPFLQETECRNSWTKFHTKSLLWSADLTTAQIILLLSIQVCVNFLVQLALYSSCGMRGLQWRSVISS